MIANGLLTCVHHVLVVAGAFPRDHIGVVGTVVTNAQGLT